MTTKKSAPAPRRIGAERLRACRRAFVLLLLASPLAACGKRGRLELPPGAQPARAVPPLGAPPLVVPPLDGDGEGDLG